MKHSGKGKKRDSCPGQASYFVKTFGCQMNEADSERMAAVLEKQGYQLAESLEEANVMVINTCSVREAAENRVFGLVNNLAKKKKKDQKIILTGCMLGSALGSRRRYTLRQLKLKLPQVDEFKPLEELIGPGKTAPKRKKRKSALVPIMRGCSHFCSYCVVPYARGEETSRPFKEIVAEVKDLAGQGFREIVLLGQNVNCYGQDFSPVKIKKVALNYQISIPDNRVPFALLLRVIHRVQGVKKISFLSSNPWNLNEEVIRAMSLPRIDRTLHLPVQSGDDRILKRMKRPYTARRYLQLVKKIKKKIPEIKFSTDIIVGFPGETRKAFENTANLCRKVGFKKAYIARYSPRPGTAAYKLKDDVSPKEKKRRWLALEKLINEKKD